MPSLRFSARSSAVSTNGIRMRVHEDGPTDGIPIVFCHGFPELAYSWRRQLKGLGERGFRAIAPDLRGYGETDRTPDLLDYRLANLCGDMTGLLDELSIERAFFVGHDLGSTLVYALAVSNPERCHGIVSLNTPYRPRSPINPIEYLCRTRGAAHYMVTFQKAPAKPDDPRTGIAENALGADVLRTFRALMLVSRRSYGELEQAFPEALELAPIGIFLGEPLLGELPLLSEEELGVYVDTYQRTGFTGGLSWYRNLVRNWEDSRTPGSPYETPRIRVPTLMIAASRDPVIRPEMAQAMPSLIDALESRELDCGHWTQQERPEEVNDLIGDWARQRLAPDPAGGRSGPGGRSDPSL